MLAFVSQSSTIAIGKAELLLLLLLFVTLVGGFNPLTKMNPWISHVKMAMLESQQPHQSPLRSVPSLSSSLWITQPSIFRRIFMIFELKAANNHTAES